MPSPLLFTWVKRVLLWVAVLLGLLHRAPGATSYEVFAAFFRLSGSGFQFAILGLVLATAVFVSRPFCHWVCPVDTAERAARHLRLLALRRLGGPGLARAGRPLRLPVGPALAPPVPVFRRLRNGLLTAAGLLCALLVLGHFHERLSAQGRGAQEGLVDRTFVSSEPR
jgi:hypothetical protein